MVFWRKSIEMNRLNNIQISFTEKHYIFLCIVLLCLTAFTPALQAGKTNGPLCVHPVNPRYFSDKNGNIVYLTGSHTWANFQEMGFENSRPFDYTEYLDLLEEYNHNFFRLWAWEQAAWITNLKKKAIIEPNIYARKGPGTALDGKRKFDITEFNQEYFDRLRRRVIDAGERGIYVSVMLFEGFSIELKGQPVGNPWNGHPFNKNNNSNGIDGDPNGDGEGREIHTLALIEITRLQEKYIKKVIDTLNDLDNVMWEIGNESHRDSEAWQYHMIDFIKEYEAKYKAKQHPVWMTVEWGPGDNDRNNSDVFRSPADAASPNSVGGYRDEPPAAQGSKVIITDTDHLWGIGGNYKWVWKSFTRGLNPIFMDPWDPWLGVGDNAAWLEKNHRGYHEWEPLRRNLGYTRKYAEKMNLAFMVPNTDVSSTQFCLANRGGEYLVYQPESCTAFTVNITAGVYDCEWFSPLSGKIENAGPVTVKSGPRQFQAPFEGDAVLYLKARQSGGVLRVSDTNPRYFTDNSGKAILMTGSHTWDNFQDITNENDNHIFNFDKYLDWLEEYNHNFIRLWTWEQAKWHPYMSANFTFSPNRYIRTKPEAALDGKRKFDVTKFNQDYFDRLRKRVEMAGERGMYVSVMLFAGWGIDAKGGTQENPWYGHPFHRSNNINGIDGDPDGDGEGREINTMMEDSRIRKIHRIQEAYVRKVIDTLNDLDHIMWEITNESHRDSDEWQYHMIEYIKQYEAQYKPKQHLVWMTSEWESGNNDENNIDLFRSPADVISPNSEGGYRDNPPMADGGKIIVSDTDHLWGVGGNYQWVWKSFLRGLHPVFMDPYDSYYYNAYDHDDKPFDPKYEAIRRNMGYVKTYADKMNLVNMVPRNDLSSTGYCLANSGKEYLIYQPLEGETFTVTLQRGRYKVEWFYPEPGTKQSAGKCMANEKKLSFTPPEKRDAVLYLKAE